MKTRLKLKRRQWAVTLSQQPSSSEILLLWGEYLGRLKWRGISQGGLSRVGNVQDNTHTHKQTESFWPALLLAQPADLKARKYHQLATCINYTDVNDSAGFFRCDVLFLQGKHNGFRHTVSSMQSDFWIGSKFWCFYLYNQNLLSIQKNSLYALATIMTKTIVFTVHKQDVTAIKLVEMWPRMRSIELFIFA